jgi:hypothetical protein
MTDAKQKVWPMPLRVPVVDLRTGGMSVEWVRYFTQRGDDGGREVAKLQGAIAALAAVVEAQAQRIDAQAQTLEAQAQTLAALTGRLAEAEALLHGALSAQDYGLQALALVAELSKRVDGLEVAA